MKIYFNQNRYALSKFFWTHLSPMRLQALSPQRQQEKANWVPSTLTLSGKKY